MGFQPESIHSLTPGHAITIVDGKFWPADYRGAPQLSVEEGYAKSLDWKLGDKIAFDIAGQVYEAELTSLRKVDWDSFRVNFFALFPPGPLEAMPATYIAAFRAPDGNNGWLPALVRAGFDGPIFCTPATADLCRILLPDAAHIQEEDARCAHQDAH